MDSSAAAAAEKSRLAAHFSRTDDNINHMNDAHSHGESLIDADSADDDAAGSGKGACGFASDQEPPMYSGPASAAHEAALAGQDGSAAAAAAAAAQRQGPTRYLGLPAIDYGLYAPPLFELSANKTSIKSSAPYLSTSASALANLVRSQATVPPKPLVQIVGNRGPKIDFDVRVNLMNLLLSDDPRLRMQYVRCVGKGELAMRGGDARKPSALPEVDGAGASDALDAWCRRYVNDSAAVKEFVLERQVANMDIGWLDGQIRSLVATTGYKGVVTVTFPILHARVVVQNPDRVNKFFTSVATLFSGKSTYEVVKSVWPFASHKPGDPGRKFAVQSEATWWKEWRDPIRYAVTSKRKGWVTNEDKLEALMEGVGKNVTVVDWGSEWCGDF